MISGDRSVLQGKQSAFWLTLQEFSKHWERIDVIVPYARGNRHLEAAPFFSNVYFHPSPWSLVWQPWWVLRRGQALFRQFGHQVMTVHDFPPFYNGIGAYWLHKKISVPYALEIHHVVGHPTAATVLEWIGKKLSQWYLPWAATKARAVRVVSASVQATLRACGVPAARLALVPSFYLDLEVLRPEPNVQKHTDFVSCARLVENKGLPELIAAMVELPHATLTIVGDGPLRPRLERLVEQWHLQGRVQLRGWLPTQQDVVAVLQMARIFVMPSSSEGGPRAALEAMACGLPIIATRVGVMPDVIQDGISGGIFTTGATNNLAAQMKKLLQASELQAQLAAGGVKTVRQFERKAAIKSYALFLQSLA